MELPPETEFIDVQETKLKQRAAGRRRKIAFIVCCRRLINSYIKGKEASGGKLFSFEKGALLE